MQFVAYTIRRGNITSIVTIIIVENVGPLVTSDIKDAVETPKCRNSVAHVEVRCTHHCEANSNLRKKHLK